MSATPSDSTGPEVLTRSRSAPRILGDALGILLRNYDYLARRSALFFIALLVGVIGTSLVAPGLLREERTTIFEPPKITQYLFFLGLAEAELLMAVTGKQLGWTAKGGLMSFRAAASSMSVVLAAFLKWLGVQVGVTALLAQAALLVRRPSMDASRWLALEGALLLAFLLGLVIFVRYFAVPATVVLEGKEVGKGAFKRSAQLAAGAWPRILASLGMAWLVLLALQVFARAMTLELSGDVLTAEVVAVLASMLTYPYIGVVATLLYADARTRKDGVTWVSTIVAPSRTPTRR